jgi:hypothetical protein
VAIVALALAGCGESGSSAVGSSEAQVATTAGSTHHTSSRASRPRRRSHHQAATRSAGAACHAPSDVLAGVYHTERLRVLAPCRVAAGTVAYVHHEPDGDVHIDVALDGGYSMLINEVNRLEQRGSLLVEFMPRDGGHLPAPTVGDHVRLTGAWVDDMDHGWNELHPVWSVQISGGAVSRSGPQYGGSPAYDRSYDAAGGCRDQAGGVCRGYEGSPSGSAYGSSPGSGGERSSSSRTSGSSPSNASVGSASFCSTHQCIASFDDGTGTIVQCADGDWSHSGGRPGVCSRHGGVKE